MKTALSKVTDILGLRHRPKVGLALGGGGVRGLAHIGVLSGLKNAGIEIDMIAGTSMGAIVGAAFVLHPNFGPALFGEIVDDLQNSLPSRLSGNTMSRISALEQIRKVIDLEKFIFDTVTGWGILPATLARETITRLTLGKNIEESSMPFRTISFDLLTGKKIVFDSGPADIAVQASSALPGFFAPVEHQGMLLADGGFVELVPAAEVRKMGADIVIAVDVDQDKPVVIRNGLEAILRATEICNRHHKNEQLKHADLVLHPNFIEPVKTFEVMKAGICLAAGDGLVEQHLPEIRQLLQ